MAQIICYWGTLYSTSVLWLGQIPQEITNEKYDNVKNSVPNRAWEFRVCKWIRQEDHCLPPILPATLEGLWELFAMLHMSTKPRKATIVLILRSQIHHIKQANSNRQKSMKVKDQLCCLNRTTLFLVGYNVINRISNVHDRAWAWLSW